MGQPFPWLIFFELCVWILNSMIYFLTSINGWYCDEILSTRSTFPNSHHALLLPSRLFLEICFVSPCIRYLSFYRVVSCPSFLYLRSSLSQLYLLYLSLTFTHVNHGCVPQMPLCPLWKSSTRTLGLFFFNLLVWAKGGCVRCILYDLGDRLRPSWSACRETFFLGSWLQFFEILMKLTSE